MTFYIKEPFKPPSNLVKTPPYQKNVSLSLTSDGIVYNGTNIGKILYLEIDKENLSRGITFKRLG